MVVGIYKKGYKMSEHTMVMSVQMSPGYNSGVPRSADTRFWDLHLETDCRHVC